MVDDVGRPLGTEGATARVSRPGQDGQRTRVAPALRELGDSDADGEALASFYNTVYQREFPDADERESLANMLDYLTQKKPAGWYGANNYHIAVAELTGRPVGLCVSDYSASANAGIIEFLVIVPEERGRGLGKQLLEFTESLIAADARRAHGCCPRGIVAEMNDPFRIALRADNMDPFDRAMLWHHWGFRRLHMPYSQPALSAAQTPVGHLMLICKPLDPRTEQWCASVLQALLHDYLVFAMRIAEPATDPCFAVMAGWLSRAQRVSLRSLAAYVGRKPPIAWQEVCDHREPAFAQAMRLYGKVFKDRQIAISDAAFAAFLDARQRTDLRYAYHLWVARGSVGEGIAGFASFFTLLRCGFGGYVVTRHALCRRAGDKGRPKPLPGAVVLAAVEERMRRDNPVIDGWFIECDSGGEEFPATLFYLHGFREVKLEYRQPPLRGSPDSFRAARVLRLLYKPFGACFPDKPSAMTVEDFLGAMADVFQVVYGMEHPLRSCYHQHLRKQLESAGSDCVPFHASGPRHRPCERAT
jgi:GNAT superfamily N-acetyltransferase